MKKLFAALLGLSLTVSAVLAYEPTYDLRVVEGMGGGPMQWGYNEAERYWRDGVPIRLEGDYVSAGTFLLWSVEQLPGSCIAPDATFSFHEPQTVLAAFVFCAPFGMDNPARADALESATRPYNDALTAWFMREIAGDSAECGFTTLTGAEVAQIGRYPLCTD